MMTITRMASALALACLFTTGLAAAQSTPAPKPARTVVQPQAVAPLNLNTATAADLQTLPGVGPAMAARILEYREKSGGFKKIEDLMNVKGIGEKNFLKLKSLVVVAPVTKSAAAR
ncbi:MAG TPA: helix-hairpin-helix domain-containing protein [Vicinamibacterales bacterium]|jgi:competence protein ComEA|nr:helix-hairpin-helix domain-containing protein [Vicinamibacterales bacterium]